MRWSRLFAVVTLYLYCGVVFGDVTGTTQRSFPRRVSRTLSGTLPKSLKEAYLAALHQSETIGIQKELLTQTDEQLNQAKGALLPAINGAFNYTKQPTPSSSIGSSISPSNQTTAKITADQPLFRGFRDFAALRQRKFLAGAQYSSLLNAAKQLFYDLSTAYYNVLSFQQDEKNYLIEIEVNRKRLKELEGFFKIGRSQLTDVLTFKSNIASLEVQLESTRGQLESAKDILAYLTGWKRDFVLHDEESALLSPTDIASYLVRIEDRPDVKVALANAQANEEGITMAFGQHYPSLDLLGNYYLTRPGTTLSDVNWDVQLALSIPIFQGGVIQSQVRQAQSVSKQYDLLLSQARRAAEEEVRLFYNAVSTDAKQVAKLSELVEISKQNAETEVKYYRNGLVTNLDVFQALTTYQEAQRQLDRQNFTAKLDTVKLQAATGQRAEVNVKP